MEGCVWDGRCLLLDPHEVSQLPEEVLELLRRGSNEEYLITLARLALDAHWTGRIFTKYEPLFADLSSRWVERLHGDSSAALEPVLSWSRLLPLAPHFSPLVEEVAGRRRLGVFKLLGTSSSVSDIQDLPTKTLTEILLLYYRLLRVKDHDFSSLVSPVQVQCLFSHEKPHIRFMASKVLCLLLHFAERTFLDLVKKHVGDLPLEAPWEGKLIDYRFLDLWEDQRLRKLYHEAQQQKTRQNDAPSAVPSRVITDSDLSSFTLNFAGYLVPSMRQRVRHSSIVLTPSSSHNIARIARAVCSVQPVLITGMPGSGKTSMVQDIAKQFGQSSKMLTLYLNEQTDAKLLIGLYTSSIESGTFKWQPGVLTTAVTEGRWVLIEDLDRAPIEVMSVLLPLLDTQELVVPNLGGPIRASPGFKLIATIRSSINAKGEEIGPNNLLGLGHWERVTLEPFVEEDLRQIISSKFPLLHAYQPRILSMYHKLKTFSAGLKHSPVGSRPYGPQELLRYCSRVVQLLGQAGIASGREAISEAVSDNMFLEAIDCFCSFLHASDTKTHLTEAIAQEMHVSAERVNYCMRLRKPPYAVDSKKLALGRATLLRDPSKLSQKFSGLRQKRRTFAMTTHALRHMESIAVAVKMSEPCLLVGETGTGKTTMIQELAAYLGRKLVVVNLSQQSEAGDLLGGFKPVTAKALATPLQSDFDVLFEDTFKSEKNERFIKSLDRNLKRGEWPRVLKLWQEALKMARDSISAKLTNGENPAKKRKVDGSKYLLLKGRWDQFSVQIDLYKKHLESGSKGFAFSFVEGNLIKAVRNGDWVLLDEINLASSDTLESLADLLLREANGSPSILLTETGDVQRVYAHPNFRIFGAMNPATDVGKRDLPLSLRSRFTEFYVSSAEDDPESLLLIVASYLGDLVHADRRLPHDIAKLYQEIRGLENENRLVDGADQKPHFTLRTLTRTLMYAVEIAPSYGARRALYEGFSMSFLTLLNRDSVSLVSPLIYNHLLSSQKNVRAILNQKPKCPGDATRHVQFRHYWMTRGPFPIEEQPYYIITPFVETNLLNLVRATSTRRYPILLQGPTSSGKTSMIEYLAKISGNKFVRINNHEHTDLQEYLGTYVSGPSGLHFEEGLLVRALREGYWLVLDELNLAPSDILEALNRLLDDNRELLIPETQETVRPHPDFMLFATQNPPGLYGGRKVLSRAFRNRFLELHFDDIPDEELETILKERSQIAPSYCTRIVSVYKKLAILRQSSRIFEQKNSFATLRDLFRWAQRDADNVEQLALNGFMLLGERVRNPEERASVRSIIEEVMRVKLNDRVIYNMDESQLERIRGSGPLASSMVMTRSMTRLFILITRALKNKEPVLLVGDTGCGKTSACQMVAEVFGNSLYILNAHQNTETGDIIGAQRPIRNKQSLRAELKSDLQSVFDSLPSDISPATKFLSEEDPNYIWTNLPTNIKDTLPTDLRQRIEAAMIRLASLFEWSDGSLVRAMKDGNHFLFDEISLADDSVLERMNSVLEPGRTLLLAEKGSVDTFIIAHDNFQFLATMNPGGDYGKKELSPALRNRFTEIWVPPLGDEEDILQVAESKLVHPISSVAEPIIAFSRWFQARYGNQSDQLSLRQILSWIEFVVQFSEQSLETSIFHGAGMVYIDSLGANPAGMLATSQNVVHEQRSTCLSKLADIFGFDASSIYYNSNEIRDEDSKISIGLFSIPKYSASQSLSSFSLNTPTTRQNAMRIVRALQLSKSLLIEGNPGVGKTTLVEALSALCGAHLTRINLSEQTDLMDLFGSDVPVESGSIGQFEWRDAPFLRAMQRGEWVLLDEMNLASQSVLEGLNACLDHRGQVYIPELDQNFSKHPDFKLFAAQNPHSQGGGRKGLPVSFVNRFTVVYADAYTEADMLSITSHVYPDVSQEISQGITDSILKVNKLILTTSGHFSAGSPWEFNLRDILRWLDLSNTKRSLLLGASVENFQNLLVNNRLRSIEDVSAIQKHLEVDTEHQIQALANGYQALSPDLLQCGYGLLERHGIASSSPALSRRHAPSIMESLVIAVEKNWPCLLVGRSGAGKSSILHDLAGHVGATLSLLSLNSDMDTMDLIGGYEQIDPHRHLTATLAQFQDSIRRVVLQRLLNDPTATDTQVLLSLFSTHESKPEEVTGILNNVDALAIPELMPLTEKCRFLLQRIKGDSRARFEWVDGILIEAMEAGNWLILDNANFCSSSVLDRLNALLEPNGVLSINEHRLEDGSPRVITRHPDFRIFLTMDPQHGELSRAMRNRCVELFLPEHAEMPHELVLPQADSHLNGFHNFVKFKWSHLSDIEVSALFCVCLDHLSLSNLQSADSWSQQIFYGLIDQIPQLENLSATVLRSYRQAMSSDGEIYAVLLQLYRTVFHHIDLKSDWQDEAALYQVSLYLTEPISH